MKKLLVFCGIVATVMLMASPAMANTIESSTMCFEGDLIVEVDSFSIFPIGIASGSVSGRLGGTDGTYYVPGGPGETIATNGGFDLYAKESGTAYVSTYTPQYETIGADHDAYNEAGAWGAWYDPDVEDSEKYFLNFNASTGSVGTWNVEYMDSGISPLSGTFSTDDFVNSITFDGLNYTHVYGSAIVQEDGANWSANWGWGDEDIPLEYGDYLLTFDLTLTDGDPLMEPATYTGTITMAPVPEPATMTLLAFGGLSLLWVMRRRRKTA